MKKLKKLLKKQGFTLVELIIVIAIIAILAVAAFMMLTKWLGKSRDSRRLGDLGTIKKALEVTYSDTDRGFNMYPDPTDSVEILDGSGVVMWNQGVFGLETISNMDNMQKAPQDPGDQSYYRYAVTLDKKEFQLGTVLEDGSDVSMIGSVLAANGEARLDGNYDGYVSYPTTGGTMIFKTPSLVVIGEPIINVFSGSTDKFMVNGEEEGGNIELRSVKTNDNTSAEEVATLLGIDEKSAAIVLKKETGAVVTVVEKVEETPSTPSCDANYSWDGSECIADNQTATCGGDIPTNASADTASTYNQTWNGSEWTPSLEWIEGATNCGFSCDTNYSWNGNECIADNQTATCGGDIPTNASADTASTYSQTRNGSAWTPKLEWTKSASICGYECDPSYGWNGTSCEYLYSNNLIAYFDMQTTESGKLKDFSPYGNHATLYGGITVGGVTGKIGNAMQFDGTNDYISFSIDNLTNTKGTISYFVKPVGWNGGDSSYQGTFQSVTPGNRTNNPAQITIFDQRNSNIYYFRINYDGGCCGDVTIPTSGFWSNNVWKHITMTWDKDTQSQTMYINGVYKTGVTNRTNFPTLDLGNIGYIGLGHDQYYHGVIDEVRIYDYALSASEVQSLYNSMN